MNGRLARYRNVDGGAAYILRCGAINDFLLETSDDNIQRAAGQKIGRGIVIARVGELPVSGRAGEVSQAQPCQKHNECENNDESRGLVRGSLEQGRGGHVWSH